MMEPTQPRSNIFGSIVKVMVGAGVAVALVLSAVFAGGLPHQRTQDKPANAYNVQSVTNARQGLSFSPTPTTLPQPVRDAALSLEAVMVNIYQRADPSVVNIEVISGPRGNQDDSSGSGFVYDKEGHIVTNAHVVDGARLISVTFRDGYVTSARVVGADNYSDLAVIKVDTDPARLVPVVMGDSRDLKVGQSVIAIGNPFGLLSSMTTGIISATGRTLNSARMISPRTRTPFQNPAILQVDAQINPGNSGGPLLNLQGEVIGVNTAIRTETGIFMGIGFAVPSNTVVRIVPQLIRTGKARYPYLGITSISPQTSGVSGLTVSALAETYRMPIDYGVLVSEVLPGTPAEKAGLRGGNEIVTIRGTEVRLGGDIIIAVDKTTVRDFDQLIAYLVSNTAPGDKVTLTVVRGDRIFDVDAILDVRPE